MTTTTQLRDGQAPKAKPSKQAKPLVAPKKADKVIRTKVDLLADMPAPFTRPAAEKAILDLKVRLATATAECGRLRTANGTADREIGDLARTLTGKNRHIGNLQRIIEDLDTRMARAANELDEADAALAMARRRWEWAMIATAVFGVFAVGQAVVGLLLRIL